MYVIVYMHTYLITSSDKFIITKYIFIIYSSIVNRKGKRANVLGLQLVSRLLTVIFYTTALHHHVSDM